MKLKGKTCVVTGAARGIGLAVCRRLAREGCALTLWDIDADALEKSRKDLEGLGSPVFGHRCDITDKGEVYRLARLAAEEMGRVDILVNNAGILFGGNLLDQPDERWEKMIDVNLTSLLYTTRAFLPAMMERDSGHIVNVSSAAGTVGVAGLAVYAATKWAVWGLTESLRHETLNAGKRGVKWSSIHPNYVAEGMFGGARMPGLGGLVIPVLRSHDVVAKAIVESALKRGRHSPKRPRTVKLASLLRGILPDAVFNRISRMLGVNVSMESWIGQGTCEEPGNGNRIVDLSEESGDRGEDRSPARAQRGGPEARDGGGAQGAAGMGRNRRAEAGRAHARPERLHRFPRRRDCRCDIALHRQDARGRGFHARCSPLPWRQPTTRASPRACTGPGSSKWATSSCSTRAPGSPVFPSESSG